jgi:hypothetical protein
MFALRGNLFPILFALKALSLDLEVRVSMRIPTMDVVTEEKCVGGPNVGLRLLLPPQRLLCQRLLLPRQLLLLLRLLLLHFLLKVEYVQFVLLQAILVVLIALHQESHQNVDARTLQLGQMEAKSRAITSFKY